MSYAYSTYTAFKRRILPQAFDTDDRHPAATGQSRLLRLPTELRLKICSYMTIVPAKIDWEWKSAFFSCTQLHKDMLDQLSPALEMERFLRTEVKLPRHIEQPHRISPGLPHPFFGWVRSVTIHIALSEEWSEIMRQLYPLYLDELHIVLRYRKGLREHRITLPWGDLKSTAPPLLMPRKPCKVELVVNCKKITVSFHPLNKAKRAMYKETSFEVTLPETDITFLFTIVENKREKQVERSYTFKNRFRLPVKEKVSPPSTRWDSLYGLLRRFW
ncbi:hypothetical protein G6514_004227 [Epicoccum nigrum]|nr:hypothetical protein G6514_004227 [Epicoccum nigrum]